MAGKQDLPPVEAVFDAEVFGPSLNMRALTDKLNRRWADGWAYHDAIVVPGGMAILIWKRNPDRKDNLT